MSPPPIAITRWMPSSSARPVIASSAGMPASTTSAPASGHGTSAWRKITPSATHSMITTRLRTWRPGSSSGLLPMMPRSLPNAMIEPLKVTAPTRTPT